MKPAIRNVFSLCGAIVVQVRGFHVEWQAMSHIMDIVKMKGMACQTPEDPVVKMTCLSTMWASSKGIEAMGFVKNQDCVTENITSMAQAGESQRESDQQDCAAITENMTSLAETKSKARVMVDCSTLDCVVDGMPALNQRCCQKQSCVKEYTKKMGGGQSNLFGCDTWWLWLVISICVVQGCWKWTDGGSVPWGRGWLTMASLVAVAEGLADTWYELSPTGGISISHYYGASVWSTIDNRMYVFGGYTGSTGSYINTLIAYDPQANAWETISPSSGTAPSARAYHTGVWDWTNGRMWIFGGASNGVKYNDLHYYDVQANQWVEVTPGGTAPTARTVHAAGFDSTNGRMWVFGGHDGSRRNDLHFYDVTANEWVEVTPGGTAPTAREGHAAGFDSTNGRMWVFGGLDGPFDGSGSRQNDLHYYDVTANEWVEVTPGGTAPTARYAQRAEWDDAGGRLWIFAGNTDTGAVNDLFYYDLQANAWVEVTPGGVTPGVRSYHHLAIDASAGRLYIYAGDGDGGVSLLYVEIEDPTTTTTVSSSATRTSTSSATRTITTTTSQTISSTTTGTASTTGTTTTTRTGSTTTTASSSTSISTTTSSSTSTSATTSSSTSTSTTTSSSMSTSTTASRSASTSSTISTSSTTTTSITTSTSTSTTSTSTSRSATTSSSSSTRSTSISSSSTTSTTATSTSTSKTMSTTSSTSTTTTTRTQSSTTTATATDSTTTTSSISSSTTSPTTTTKTGTAIPEGGLTIEELEALEEKRKEEAAQAVAAVEAAENNAVAEAIAAIALQGNASASAPGILGEVTISSEAGPVKVAALSLEALGNDSVPVKVSAGETGAELEVSAGLLGDVVLLSVAGLPQDAAARLATDDVRAESPDPGPPGPGGARRLASALRSQPLSINFRAADGTKINVTNLTTPMKMTLTVEDPTATCAFWDGATAQWSAKGVQTIPSEIPGILECETTHLSIFGGVVDVALRNVILVLECSTVGAVLTPEAMAKMVEDGEWLGRPATLVTLAVAVGFLGLLKLALRSDQRFKETLPWDEREDFLMCVKAKASPQDPREGAAGAGAADAVEQPPQNEAEQHGKTNDKGADEVQRDRDEQPRVNRGDEEVKSEEKEEEEKKDEAAGGLEKLPSIFRTVRGIVEGLLDTISQALGGENVLYSIKEIISNAESGAIHRAIASLQSHRSGADQATVRALQRGDTSWVNEEALDADAEGERRRDATSVRIEGSAEDLPLEGEESVPVADEAFGRRQRSAAEIEVQPMNPEDFADRREVSPVHEAAPVRKDGAAEVQGESRCGRRPPPPCLLLQQRAEEKEEEEEEELTQNLRSHDRQPRPRASMIEMIGAAFRAAQRRSAALFAKARAMHGRLAEDGAGAAKRYLESNFFGRVFMLFPAVHNWLKLSQFSIVVPCIIRTELIELKVWSCAFLNAVFFSSTLPPPDSDPACRPESGSVAYWAQKFTVGTVSATVGDFIILLLFLMVRIRIEERDEWTDEDKTERRKWWRNRTIAFWFIAVLYKSFCIFYVCAFIANVSKEDANQLLEATAMSLLQDLVLKPAILALILAVVSTLVLTCRPSIKRNIQAKWMEDRSVEHVAAKDSRGSPIPSEFCEANDVKEVPESLTPAPEPVEPPTLLDIGSSINRFKDWPFHVEEGDGHQPIRPIRPVRDPNEAQFASVLPGMPGP